MTMPEYTLNTAEYEGKRVTIRSLPGDLMVCKYRSHQYYEKDLLVAIANRKLSGTYVDVGANIGNHTIFFAEHCPSTHVVAVEPRSDIFRALALNVAGIACSSKVSAVRCAAGACNSTGSIVQRSDGNAGSSAITGAASGADSVVIRPLDDIIDFTDVVVVKIDVEGYEELVLAGSTRILSQRPLLAIECQSVEQFNGISEKLTPLGYTCKGKYCATPTYIFECDNKR